MNIVKYDAENFCAALEPGIVTLVVSTFEKKLEEKLNKVVKSVYEELKKELPEEIKARVFSIFDPQIEGQRIKIEVEVEMKKIKGG